MKLWPYNLNGPDFLTVFTIAIVLALLAWVWLRGRQLAKLPLALVGVAGVVRLIQGLRHQRPVGFLLFELFVVLTLLMALPPAGGSISGCSGDSGCSSCSSCSSGGGCCGCGGGGD